MEQDLRPGWRIVRSVDTIILPCGTKLDAFVSSERLTYSG